MKQLDRARFDEHLRRAFAALPDRVLERATAHGLDAVLGYAIVRGLIVPPGQAAALVTAHKARLAHDLALRAPLERLANAFAEAGIPALLLKGEAWSRGIYPVAGVRARGDCDIWVPRHQRDRAVAVLNCLGIYEVRPYGCHGEVLGPEALFQGMGLNIDLHWQLSTLSSITQGLDFDHCWQTSVPVPDLIGWRMLGPIEALLHAALHLSCSAGDRWIWALDGLLLLDWAATDHATLDQRAAQARIADLWKIFMDYTDRLAHSDTVQVASIYRPGHVWRLLLGRAPWPARLQAIGELLWPREAFLRDRYPDTQAPRWWLALRRLHASLRKLIRQL